MPNKNKTKGNALEKAVQIIQRAILRSDPKLVGTKFTIEANKIEIISGVRHEIDILVKTLPDSLYESVSVFECKNWSKPVGKNEVICLAAKVEALRATKGFLVARAFSKDAIAQARLDPRLALIICKDDFLSPVPFEIFHLSHQPDCVEVRIKERGHPPVEHPKTFDWKHANCRLNNQRVDFGAYIKQQVDEIVAADKKEKGTRYERESSHWDQRAVLIQFAPNEFALDGKDIEHMTVEVSFWVTIRKPRIISQFELDGHGCVFSFEPIEDAALGKKLEINLVVRR